MATTITQGDDNACLVNTNLSLSDEQIRAVSDFYEKKLDYERAYHEMIQQLADAGYNTEAIDEFVNNISLVSEAKARYEELKSTALDPRLFQAVQQTLLAHNIIRFANPEAEDTPDDLLPSERDEKPSKRQRRKLSELEKHPNRNTWEDTVYD